MHAQRFFPDSYTQSPGLGFYRLVLGHMTILKPIRFGKRMSYSDWPILGLILFPRGRGRSALSELREREREGGARG